jgi:hypothetical protein
MRHTLIDGHASLVRASCRASFYDSAEADEQSAMGGFGRHALTRPAAGPGGRVHSRRERSRAQLPDRNRRPG